MMSYNYCPRCGVKLNNDLIVHWLKGLCVKRHSIIEAECPSCHYRFTVRAIDALKLPHSAEPPVRELLDMMEAKGESIRPALDVRRFLELREKYGAEKANPPWTDDVSTLFNWADEAAAVINELLNAAEARPAKASVEPGKYDYMEIVGKLIAEVERIRRD